MVAKKCVPMFPDNKKAKEITLVLEDTDTNQVKLTELMPMKKVTRGESTEIQHGHC